MPSKHRRRFPAPWSVEPLAECFVVRDATGFALAYIYFDDDTYRASANGRMTSDEARRIAANIAKLPDVLGKGVPVGLEWAQTSKRPKAGELQGKVLRVWCDKCIRKIERDGDALLRQFDPGLYVSHIAYSLMACTTRPKWCRFRWNLLPK